MTVLAQMLVFIGVAVVFAATATILRARRVLTRLHLLSLVTTIGAPLIGAGLIVVNGATLGSGAILATVALLAVTGPILQSAIARLEARRRGATDEDLPS